MSSIMRARSGLTRRSERLEGIGGSSLEPKVAGPSMLGIGCPDRHPLPLIAPPNCAQAVTRAPPARAGSFSAPQQPFAGTVLSDVVPAVHTGTSADSDEVLVRQGSTGKLHELAA